MQQLTAKAAVFVVLMAGLACGFDVERPSRVCTSFVPKEEESENRLLMGEDFILGSMGEMAPGMEEPSFTLRGNGNLRQDEFEDELMMLEGALVQKDESVDAVLMSDATVDYFEGEGWVLYALTFNYPFMSYTTYEVLKQVKSGTYTVIGNETHSSQTDALWWKPEKIEAGKALVQHIEEAVNSINALKGSQPNQIKTTEINLIGGEMYLLQMALPGGYSMNMTLIHFQDHWHRLSTSLATPPKQCDKPSYAKMTQAAIQQDKLLHAMYRYVFRHVSRMVRGMQVGWITRGEFSNATILYQVVYLRANVAVNVLEMVYDPKTRTLVNVAFRNATQVDTQMNEATDSTDQEEEQPEEESEPEEQQIPDLSVEEMQAWAKKFLVTKHPILGYNVEFEEVESERKGDAHLFTFTVIDRQTHFWRIVLAVELKQGAVRQLSIKKCQ